MCVPNSLHLQPDAQARGPVLGPHHLLLGLLTVLPPGPKDSPSSVQPTAPPWLTLQQSPLGWLHPETPSLPNRVCNCPLNASTQQSLK